jgi:hypothetical protein
MLIERLSGCRVVFWYDVRPFGDDRLAGSSILAPFSSELRMQYTVWSGERQLGATDLGFRYRDGGSRMGWFYPSAVGEALMPEVVDPLIGSYFKPCERTATGPLSSDEFARLAEYERACKRAAAWDLRLRREDGSLVPTESVGIRDVEALLACYPTDETLEDELDGAFEFDDDPSEAWKHASEDEATAALRRDIEHDRALIEEELEEKSETHQWTPEDDEPFPRYQILVLLSDPTAVP